MHQFDLKKKTAVITGGAQGFGLNITKKFLLSGAKVFIWDIDEKELIKAVKEINNPNLEYNVVDVTNFNEIQNTVKKITTNNNVDILINNAGITDDKLAIRMSEDSWNEVINVNLKGTFNCIKTVLPNMIKNKGGKIVNMSSVVGIMGNPGQSNYCASKAGIIGLTKSLAKEYGKKSININAIAPGLIETDMTKKINIESFSKNIVLDRLGTPNDIANLVCFLCSKDASYITGQIINVDGGLLI